MSRKLRIYISGGITGVPEYEKQFEIAEKILSERKELEVINPVKICKNLPESFTHKEYMKICISALDSCDGIFMLTGYQNSRGALQEMGYAKGKGIKVYNE